MPAPSDAAGNRREETFFEGDDYRTYVELMAQWCGRCGVEVWAYCLMPNHVHLIVVPSDEEGLAGAIGEAQRGEIARQTIGPLPVCKERPDSGRGQSHFRYATIGTVPRKSGQSPENRHASYLEWRKDHATTRVSEDDRTGRGWRDSEPL